MEQTEIYAKLTAIFHDLFDDASIEIGAKTTANDVPEWDSFNHINLIVAVEDEFKVKFQAAELEKFHNVGALVASVQDKLTKQGR